MLFYDSVGPNPRVVRMFMSERGISDIPVETVDIRAGVNRQPEFLARNPSGQCPALVLDNGMVLAEITAICEYLDEIGPMGKTLIGSTAEERAETRMWVRRIDLNIVEPMGAGFRFAEGLKMFENRIHCIPQAADDFKAIAQEKLTWLDGLIAERRFVCGDRLTLADVLLLCFVDFGVMVKQPLNPANTHIAAWYARMKERPSAAA